MKRFALFCFSLLCLSMTTLIGFHIGSRSAQADQRAAVASAFRNAESAEWVFVLQDGDLYIASEKDLEDGKPAAYMLNVFEKRETGK